MCLVSDLLQQPELGSEIESDLSDNLEKINCFSSKLDKFLHGVFY